MHTQVTAQEDIFFSFEEISVSAVSRLRVCLAATSLGPRTCLDNTSVSPYMSVVLLGYFCFPFDTWGSREVPCNGLYLPLSLSLFARGLYRCILVEEDVRGVQTVKAYTNIYARLSTYNLRHCVHRYICTEPERASYLGRSISAENQVSVHT